MYLAGQLSRGCKAQKSECDVLTFPLTTGPQLGGALQHPVCEPTERPQPLLHLPRGRTHHGQPTAHRRQGELQIRGA